MEHREKKPVTDIFLFFLLLVLALLGIIALFFRGLAPEAGYPFLIPILALSFVHPILCIDAHFSPLQGGLNIDAPREKTMFMIAVTSVCLFLTLSVLGETNGFGPALACFAPGIAYLSGLPSAFFHAYCLAEDRLRNERLSTMKKAAACALLVAFVAFSISGAVMVFLGEMPYALFLLPIIGFSFAFPLKAFA